jgi:hypothetical protein
MTIRAPEVHRYPEVRQMMLAAFLPVPEPLDIEEPMDGITHEAIPDGELVFVLDDCRTTPVTYRTLESVFQTTNRNPFTNLPVQSIKKYRIRVPQRPRTPSNASSVTYVSDMD